MLLPNNNNKVCQSLCEAAEVGERVWVKAGDVVAVGEFEDNNKNSSEQQQLSGGRRYKPKYTPGQERKHHNKKNSHETSNKTV